MAAKKKIVKPSKTQKKLEERRCKADSQGRREGRGQAFGGQALGKPMSVKPAAKVVAVKPAAVKAAPPAQQTPGELA